jgi:hypothetical protein
MNPPKFTEKISDNTLCNYFYIFFVIFSVWAGLSLVAGIYLFSTTKFSASMLFALIVNVLLSFGISATSALFLYLICERSLKPSASASTKKVQGTQDMMYPDSSAMMM